MGGLLPGGPAPLEKAEGGAASRIEERLDGGVGVLRRVVDLRDVVYGSHPIVKLAQAREQLVDVYVLRPIDGGKPEQNILVISGGPGRGARFVVTQDAVGQKTAQRRFELVVVRIDEPRHDDAPGRVDLAGAVCAQIGSDIEDLFAFNEHIGLGKIADLRIQRHH